MKYPISRLATMFMIAAVFMAFFRDSVYGYPGGLGLLKLVLHTAAWLFVSWKLIAAQMYEENGATLVAIVSDKEGR